MGQPNWAYIKSGSDFQALACNLIYALDSKAYLFGRPGKDAAQDAKSGDGSIVYQAKYVANQSASTAIKEAKQEKAKIAKYQNEGHANSRHWKGVKQWVLVTNSHFNPADREKWNTQVVPEFKKLGLSVELWPKELIEIKLVQQPEIKSHFFEGENRALLFLPEVSGREDIFILPRTLQLEILDRTKETGDIIEELSSGSKRWTAVVGAGGIGKSRLLYEVGVAVSEELRWQVLWGNVHTMSETSGWLATINQERQTLLILDEPSESLLRVVNEQFRSGNTRSQNWKFLVALRHLDSPEHRYLTSPKLENSTKVVQLNRLSRTQALTFTQNILGTVPFHEQRFESIEKVANSIIDVSDGLPGYICLCVRCLEEGKYGREILLSLSALATSYLEELNHGSKLAPQFLRWLALVGVLNVEDRGAIATFMSAAKLQSEEELHHGLKVLLERSIAFRFGSRERLIGIKPDILRDTILGEWLAYKPVGKGEEWRPSMAALELIDSFINDALSGSITAVSSSTLRCLVKVDSLLCSGRTTPGLLRCFFDKLQGKFLDFTVVVRESVVKCVASIAWECPEQACELAQLARSNPAHPVTESVLATVIEYNQENVILACRDLLVSASFGCRDRQLMKRLLTEVFELCRLTTAKLRDHQKIQAMSPIRRIVEGRQEFRSDFLEVALDLAQQKMDALPEQPHRDDLEALGGLLQVTTSCEFRPSWFDGKSVHVARVNITGNQKLLEKRSRLVEKIWSELQSGARKLEYRCLLWSVLNPLQTFELQESLSRIVTILKARELDIEELQSARQLWKNLRLEDRPAVKDSVDLLEQLYSNSSLVKEFHEILNLATTPAVTDATRRYVKDLAAKSAADIQACFERALRFLYKRNALSDISSRMYQLLAFLGQAASEKPEVQSFVKQCLKSTEVNFQTIGIQASSSWLERVKTEIGAQQSVTLLTEMLTSLAPPQLKCRLISSHFRYSTKYEPIEAAFILENAEPFIQGDDLPGYISIVAPVLIGASPEVREMISGLFQGITVEAANNSILELLEYVSRLPSNNAPICAFDMTCWVASLAVKHGEIHSLVFSKSWYLDQLVDKFGHLSHQALYDLLVENTAPAERGNDSRSLGDLAYLTQAVKMDNAADSDLRSILTKLLNLLVNQKRGSQELVEFIRHVDPVGLLLPELATEMPVVPGPTVYLLARAASAYPLGTPSWKRIAAHVLSSLDETERRPIYWELIDKNLSWSGVPGEVPIVFFERVQEAQELLANETDDILKLFWIWHLKQVSADLESEKEEIKEELDSL